MAKKYPSILMVCLGNICRSPMAEGILRKKLNERGIESVIDSAGTGGWHAGENPDPRAIKTMKNYGIDISNLVARQFVKNDLDQFDKILAMDESNYDHIISMAEGTGSDQKVELILNHHPEHKKLNLSVPDPWYGNQDGFKHVYDLIDRSCDEIIKDYFN